MSWLCKNGHLVKHSYQAGTECSKCRNNTLRKQKRKSDKKPKDEVN